MLLTEIFDYTIRNCGQHVTNKDNLEIKEAPFVDLVEQTLGHYEEYFPLVDTFNINIAGSRTYTFTSTELKYGIPRKVISVTPMPRFSGNPLFNWGGLERWRQPFQHRSQNRNMRVKDWFPWVYDRDRASLTVPYDARVTVRATFGYKQDKYAEVFYNNMWIRSRNVFDSLVDYEVVFNGIDTVETTVNDWLASNPTGDLEYDVRYKDMVLPAGTVIFQPTDDPIYSYPYINIREHDIFFDMLTASFAEQLAMARDTYTMQEMPIETNADQLRAFADKLSEKVEEKIENRSKHSLSYKR